MAESDSRFSSIVSLVVGLIFIAIGFWLLQREEHEARTLAESTGHVVDSIKGSRHDNTTKKDTVTWAPVIEFTVDGGAVRFTGSPDTVHESDGNVVAVRYDPASPQATAQVVGALDGLIPWTAFAMGGLSALVGLGGLLRRLFRKD
jgi:hypothetical protein